MPSFIENLASPECWLQGGYLEPYTSRWIECGLGPSIVWFILKWWISVSIVVGIIQNIHEGIQSGNISQENIQRRLRLMFYRSKSHLGNIILGIVAIPLPLLVIWLRRGLWTGDVAIGFALFLLGWIPAIVYAWYIIVTTSKIHNGPRIAKQRNEYVVNEIKAMEKDEDGRPMYLVSWEGYYSDQDTWEYAASIDREALQTFRVRNGERRERPRSSSRRRSSTRRPSANPTLNGRPTW